MTTTSTPTTATATGADLRRVAPPAPLPPDVRTDLMDAVAPLAAGAANVVMQLARLPVGRGVAESRVHSGRVDLHPIKRLRTTMSFLVVALHGTEAERAGLRREINRAHVHVHSLPQDAVAYNAFDPELQLWVAACLYKGTEDTYVWLHGRPDDATLDALYHHCARLGTTLQVPPERWPADRAAFQTYWEDGLAQCQMDEVTRPYLQSVARLGFLPTPLRWTFGPLHELLTVGFVEPSLRDELGLPWSDGHQRRFDAVTGAMAQVNRLLPGPVRRLPMTAYLWDVRRRLRDHRCVV